MSPDPYPGPVGLLSSLELLGAKRGGAVLKGILRISSSSLRNFMRSADAVCWLVRPAVVRLPLPANEVRNAPSPEPAHN